MLCCAALWFLPIVLEVLRVFVGLLAAFFLDVQCTFFVVAWGLS